MASTAATGVYELNKTDDPRLTAEEQVYSVFRGGSSVNNTAFMNPTNSNYNLVIPVLPPSVGTVFSRAVILEVELNNAIDYVQSPSMSVGKGVAALIPDPLVDTWPYQAGVPLVQPGCLALAASHPIGQMFQSWTVQVNSASTQEQSVPHQAMVHLLENSEQRNGCGTTTRFGKLASWDDAYGTTMGLGSYGDDQADGDSPPGAYPFKWCDSAGTPLVGDGWYSTMPNTPAVAAGGGFYPWSGVTLPPIGATYTLVPFKNGMPYTCAENAEGAVGGGRTITVFVKQMLIDPVWCPPFGLSARAAFDQGGMYGVSSMLFQGVIADPQQARLWQCSTVNGASIRPAVGAVRWMPNIGVNRAALWFTFLNPNMQNELPVRNVVPMCTTQFFQQSIAVPPGNSAGQTTFTFNNVTFAVVPDYFLIDVAPTPANQLPNESFWHGTYKTGAINNFTFANQPGLFGGFSSFMLTLMSKSNGSRASVLQYGGADGTGLVNVNGALTRTAGSILVIRPGKDFPLPPGTSVGSAGQCQLSFQLTFQHPPTASSGAQYTCTVTSLIKTYFVTEEGVSRIVQVALDEAAVLAAPKGGDTTHAAGLVSGGLMGGSLFSRFGEAMKHAHHVAETVGHVAHTAHGLSSMFGGDVGGAGLKRTRMNFGARMSS